MLVYKNFKIKIENCIDKESHWLIPRRLINIEIDGYETINKNKCQTIEEYIKCLERYRDTTEGLFATDRPDLIEDPKNIMFKLEM